MARNAVQRRGAFAWASLFFGFFELFPLRPDVVNGFGFALAEDVGMAMDEFVDEPAADLIEIKGIALLPQLAVEDYLQEQVAEFLDHLFLVAGLNCVDEFVDFLDGAKAQAHVVLFAIPRATFRRAKRGHNLEDPLNRRLVFFGSLHRIRE